MEIPGKIRYHKAMMKLLICYGILLGLTVTFWGPGIALAQSPIPPQQSPGAVLNYNQREMWWRQNAPWMFGPVTEEDVSPPDEPVIEFHDMEVQAEILPSGGVPLKPAESEPASP